MLLMKVGVAPWAEYSPKNMEMGMEKMTEMTRARKEVARVPTRKGKAPNSLLTGSHVALKKNRIPKFRMAGKDAMTSEKKMANRRSRTNAPVMESILLKEDSESTGLCQRIVSILAPSTRTSALLWFIFHIPLFYREVDAFGWKTKPLKITLRRVFPQKPGRRGGIGSTLVPPQITS
jgi:hypothetical protein